MTKKRVKSVKRVWSHSTSESFYILQSSNVCYRFRNKMWSSNNWFIIFKESCQRSKCPLFLMFSRIVMCHRISFLMPRIILNTRIYNPIFVPQIIPLLWRDAIISSKTDCAVVARRRREAMVKLEVIKQ